jgi:hypothetical protein
MERPLLNDQTEYPSDEVLTRCLGKAKPAWDAFAAGIPERLPEASLEWRYYNDGKAWLCKLVRGKKTVCWISVWDKFFKTAFYFTQKSDKDIAALPIPAELKDRYREHAAIGKLKPLVIEVKTRKALDPVFVVVKYKAALK